MLMLNIAKRGFAVACISHLDGSSSRQVRATGEDLWYDPFPELPNSE